jgi:hypothetical protein
MLMSITGMTPLTRLRHAFTTKLADRYSSPGPKAASRIVCRAAVFSTTMTLLGNSVSALCTDA